MTRSGFSNSQMCICHCNEGFMHCNPIIISLPILLTFCSCPALIFLVTWTTAALLFFLHIALMHKHHSHWMYFFDHSFQLYLLMSFSQTAMKLSLSTAVQSWWWMFLQASPSNEPFTVNWIFSYCYLDTKSMTYVPAQHFIHATEHRWMLIA